MNVFRVSKTIRRVGYNCGLPILSVEFGLGASYSVESLLRKLVAEGLHEKGWVVIRNGYGERSVGTFVDALSYVHCKSEVEAYGHQPTPTWFNRVDRWTVFWDGKRVFNFGALRKGRDMVVSRDLDGLLAGLGNDDLVDRGYVAKSLSDGELEVLMKYQIRLFVDGKEEG